MTKDYDELIRSKLVSQKSSGFKPRKFTTPLWKWQRDPVSIAIQKGRYALFEDCGLGKTIQYTEWSDQVRKHTGKSVLVLCPLAVAAQSILEAQRFGVEIISAREPEDVTTPAIYITNYDRLEKFVGIVDQFAGVVLDESSILKSFTGKTRTLLTETFANTPYRLCCTATPSPNDFMELGQHSEFLGVMPSNEMLSRWFINDTMNFGTYRIKGHAREDFWAWVGSWAACISKPSDIGHSDEGYVLPELKLLTHTITIDETKDAKDELFRVTKVNATTLHAEARRSIGERVQMALRIAQEDDSPCVIWCELNDESDALEAVFPESETVVVSGSDKPEVKERKFNKFTNGEARFIVTKPEMGGFGLNWQHCHRQIFIGQSYSMESEYQAIRRCYRFGQKHPVTIHFIVPSTLADVRLQVKEKFEQHAQMQNDMRTAAMSMKGELKLAMNTDIKFEEGHGWKIYNGDCVRVAKTIESDSIDFSIYSPPFANLYIYSSDVQDMGNCLDHAEFMKQYRFAIDEKLRITKPGCLSAVHCKQTVKYAGRDGASGLVDFRGMIIREHEEAGWIYHSEFLIWKDPVIEMQRTKAQGLLFKQLCKDSRFSRAGMPEYLLIFRKWSDDKEVMNQCPVSHNDGEAWDFIGTDGPPPDDDHRYRNINIWQKYASPVWMDIRQTNVLNSKQARDPADEKHICPLQLDVIARALWLYTKAGSKIWSPFTGIGSEPSVAISMNRKFVGSELKESYWKTACAFARKAESESRTLFEMEAV